MTTTAGRAGLVFDDDGALAEIQCRNHLGQPYFEMILDDLEQGDVGVSVNLVDRHLHVTVLTDFGVDSLDDTVAASYVVVWVERNDTTLVLVPDGSATS